MLGDDKIKDLFSSKLGQGFEPEVPAGMWAGIDQLLSQLPVPAADPASSSATSSSSSASAGGTGSSVGAKVGIGLAISAVVGSSIVYIAVKNPEHAIDDNKEIPVEPVVEQPIPDTTLVLDSLDFEPQPIVTPKASSPIEDTIDKPQPVVQDTLEEALLPRVNEHDGDSISPDLADSDMNVGQKKKSYVALVGSFDIIGVNINQNNPNGVLLSQSYRSDAFLSVLDKEGAKYLLSHQQPISVGLLLGRQLNSRLSVETGIVYTHLSSLLTSTSNFQIRETQRFDYMGVPLNIRYTLFNLGKLEFDAQFGGMIQKDIQGRLISTIDNLDYGFETTDRPFVEPKYLNDFIRQSNPQFSLSGSLGITYPFYKHFSLFGTFGGVYYFDAGNKYRTIYSDQKFQLNTTVGLKFNF